MKKRRLQRDNDDGTPNLLRWNATLPTGHQRHIERQGIIAESASDDALRISSHFSISENYIFRRSLQFSLALLSGIVWLRYYMFYDHLYPVSISNHAPVKNDPQHSNQSRKKNPNQEHRPTPWDTSAKPPDPIKLFQTTDEVILRRHQCIASIRERQLLLFGPWMHNRGYQHQQTVLLVDPAYHENVGDHMITLGEHEFLRRLGWAVELDAYQQRQKRSMEDETKTLTQEPLSFNNAVYQECHYLQAGDYVPRCDNVLKELQAEKKLALWHGGGNWGDLWPQIQALRIGQSFRAILAHNFSTVVGMPQSLFYRHPESERSDSRLLKRELRVGSTILQQQRSRDSQNDDNTQNFSASVVLSWREHTSFHKAQQLYPYVTNLLVPDIAFQLGPYHIQQKDSDPASKFEQVDFVFLLRRDHESTILPDLFAGPENADDDDNEVENENSSQQKQHQQQHEQQNITKILQDVVLSAMQGVSKNKSFSYQIVDWPDRMRLFSSNTQFFSTDSIKILQMGQVVICDRLHAAILAYLSGIPFVYLDQVTGKITKCLQVAFDTSESCGAAAVEDQSSTIETFRYARAENLTEAIRFGARMLRPL